jgi:ADP-heptose:LPS heptosyltransferase
MKLLDSINRLIFSQRKKQRDSNLGPVLVVSNTGFGDTILSTPAIKSLRDSFTNEEITFLINKKYSGLFINYKYVDKIWEYSGSYINLFALIIKCRLNNIHTIMLFHSNGPEDLFISLLSGANNILKCTVNANHPYKKLFLNKIVSKQQHNIENKNDLVRVFKPTFIDTKMTISDFFYNQKPVSFLPSSQKIVGIQIGAQDIYKIWPVENIIKLSKYLLGKNYFLVFFGSTRLEYQMMLEIENSVDSSNVCNLVCKTKIIELPAILKRLNMLVTNDTGILHLAIAMKIRSLSLFGPTSSKEFGAIQDNELHKSIQKNGFFVNDKPKKMRNQDGMKLIKVQEVISKIEEII